MSIETSRIKEVPPTPNKMKYKVVYLGDEKMNSRI